jgi:hypothetical protein
MSVIMVLSAPDSYTRLFLRPSAFHKSFSRNE